MAFLNRVGNLLKQSVSKNVTSASSASNPSLFQAIRSMSSSKLFVGGLSWGTDEGSLREAFSQYGEVADVRIIMDRETGKSRGFGFVTFTSTEAASSAIQACDGQDLHGRTIRVNYATDKPRGGGFGGGYGSGGGFGGGYGSGGGGQYGGQGGNYGGGGYQGGNYGSGDGNYNGGVGFGGGNQYPSGGGGGYVGSDNYSGGYPSGGSGGFGSDDSAHGGVKYSGEKPNFASLLRDEPAEAHGGNQDPVGGETEGGNEDFGVGVDGNERDEDDYANTRS